MKKLLILFPLLFSLGCHTTKTCDCAHYDWKCGGSCETVLTDEGIRNDNGNL